MVLHGLSWFPVKQVWQISIALCGSEECGGGGEEGEAAVNATMQ